MEISRRVFIFMTVSTAIALFVIIYFSTGYIDTKFRSMHPTPTITFYPTLEPTKEMSKEDKEWLEQQMKIKNPMNATSIDRQELNTCQYEEDKGCGLEVKTQHNCDEIVCCYNGNNTFASITKYECKKKDEEVYENAKIKYQQMLDKINALTDVNKRQPMTDCLVDEVNKRKYEQYDIVYDRAWNYCAASIGI